MNATSSAPDGRKKADSGSIRLPRHRFAWIEILRRIYEFESSRLSGPGSWKKDIRAALWSFEELASVLGLDLRVQDDYRTVLDWLVQTRHAMRVEAPNKSLFITRVAEIVRLLGHTPEYWHRGRPGIDAVRWLVDNKRVPRREISFADFGAQLNKVIDDSAKSEWRANLKVAVGSVLPKVAAVVAERARLKDASEVRFSQFQLDASIEMILAEFGTSARPAQVITAGVGSGKTFAFLIPTLISTLARLRAGEGERRTALLIYPRKALSRDQADVVKAVVSAINHPFLQVHFEHYDSYQTGPLKESVKGGLERVYGGDNPPPAIVITTLETLKRRLQHPLFAAKIARHLNRVVLDEVHLIEGLGGANVVRLMDRLRALCGSAHPNVPLLWTASSATVAHPHVHASVIFGLSTSKIKVVQPLEEEMDIVGLAHHVFLRPSGHISTLGALVNATSILVHNRRSDVGTRKKDQQNPKTIGFADNLDLLGRWNADLRENERTEESHGFRNERRHPSSPNRAEWKAREREVPYAIRFMHPIESRIGAGVGEEPYKPVLTDFRSASLCERCQKGERISLGERTADEIRELSKLVYRRPMKEKDELKAFFIRNPVVYDGTAQEIGTLDLCPYLRAGACFWFPYETEDVEMIPGSDSKYEWKSVVRSKIHSAKTAVSSDVLAEDLAEVIFRAPASEIYDIYEDSTEIPIDVVLASPSLEVGIDLPNVTESIMFHAIRNVASYRQKTGRIGREEGSDTVNVSLMGDRPIDLHFYRQPRKLISLAQLDPLPLKDTNEAVLRNALYMAVWDWLALNTDLPEAVPLSIEPNSSLFSRKLQEASRILRGARQAVAVHLASVSRGRGSTSSEIGEAINQVEAELSFWVSNVSEILGPGVSTLADIVPNLLSQHGHRIMPTPRVKPLLDELLKNTEEYWAHRSRINPIDVGLSEVFERLDLMARSGWTLDMLRPCVISLEEKLTHVELTGPERRPLRRLRELVIEVREILDELAIDPKPLYFYTQFKTFQEKNQPLAHYLSYIMGGLDVFHLFRTRSEHVRIKNLFTSPHEEEVEIKWAHGREEKVPLSEALFSLIPGTWTYRFGKRAVKVKSGHVTPSEGNVLSVSLAELTDQQSQFVRVKQSVPGPPGFQRTFDVMRPTHLRVAGLNDKYVTLDYRTGSVMDGDESDIRSGADAKSVKIPKSYLNRWVHVEPGEGEHVFALDQDIGSLAILAPDGTPESQGIDAAKRLRHPFAAAFLSGVFWHKRMQVTEFIYSCSRTYTSLQISGVELVFEGQTRTPMAFGQTIETEGLSIGLEASTVKTVQENVMNSLIGGAVQWAPTATKAFSSYLNSLGTSESSPVSIFLIRDLVAIISASLYEKGAKWTPGSLFQELQELVRNQAKFAELAGQYYQGATILERDDRESVQPSEGEGSERDLVELQAKVNRLQHVAESLSSQVGDLDEYVEQWVVYTLLNSFGTAASIALQRLAGVTEDVVGYAVDFDGIKDGKYRVFLYDKDAFGSGSSDLARRFLHILHIQRHGESVDSRLLPSDDFFTVLEEELLQCPQHHTDVSAIEMLRQKVHGQQEVGIAALGYVKAQAGEVLANAGSTWKKLGIADNADAWRLPIMRQQGQILARARNIEMDDFIRSTTICWNGCPECLLNRETMMGGLGGELHLDKAVLDEWFRRGRQGSGEYLELELPRLAAGEVNLPFGRLSRVVLNLTNRRVRSTSLPYTIGIEVTRASGEPRLILRASDIEGLSLFEKAAAAPTHGIESLGFRRLLWHDLVLTAYLYLLGLLPQERRSIKAVFYDCRDVNFEDVGVSPRMLDAIVEHARSRSEILEVPENLSDMLLWMAKRGFTISLCVEKTRLVEEGVRNFVERLRTGGCQVVSKELGGVMHKKALITPMGAIEGSANLTQAGMRMNEEIINYARYGTQAYLEIQTAVDDTFHGAAPIP